jgi:hypothetical protein
MNYPETQYTFSPEHGVHIGHQAPIHYPQHTSQSQHLERYFLGHSHSDFADFAHHASMMDEYEDGTEPSTRPRLTKDQVDVLESQFQAQPKPNSNVKRQLAVQTNLSLPRVAVSSQNSLSNFKTDWCRIGFKTAEQRPNNRRSKKSSRPKEHWDLGKSGKVKVACHLAAPGHSISILQLRRQSRTQTSYR